MSAFLQPESVGQGWLQVAELGLACALSSLIGLEREIRLKDAGLRTHTVVGVAAALIMLVSKYGFNEVLVDNQIVLDPSRVAAQIVSGIGFIGGGLIFVRGDIVRGLTTAAVVWLTAAVGMACAAGLPVLAVCATAAHFVVIYGYTPIARRILSAQTEMALRYRGREGVMRQVLATCTSRGFLIDNFSLDRAPDGNADDVASVRLRLVGRKSTAELAAAIADIPGVLAVDTESRQ